MLDTEPRMQVYHYVSLNISRLSELTSLHWIYLLQDRYNKNNIKNTKIITL